MKTLLTAIAIIVTIIIMCLDWNCNQPAPPTPPKRDSIITIINEKTKYDSILVDHWHKAIHITDSVIKLVYFSAPDTCQPYLDTMQILFNSERESVQKVVSSKDSIIVQYNALSKLDSTSISNLQNDTATLRNKLKKGKYSFVIGYALGLTTGIIINIIK